MSEFVHSDLGQLSQGDIVEVSLDKGANVRLLDSSNFSNYKSGRKHTYYGGLAQRSPVRLEVPRSGRWHTVIDMQGLRGGQIRTGVRVIPRSALRPLPPIRERRAEIAEVLDNADDIPLVSAAPEAREYDVFISHASEDKEAVVRPLAEALRSHGVTVWYDEFELRIGDSLRRKIDAGIARSRFGLIVLSKPFLAKGWPQYELDGMTTMSVSGRQVLLPVWHDISKDEVVSHSPSLADKVALRTSDYSIAEIAAEIAAVINDKKG